MRVSPFWKFVITATLASCLTVVNLPHNFSQGNRFEMKISEPQNALLHSQILTVASVVKMTV